MTAVYVLKLALAATKSGTDVANAFQSRTSNIAELLTNGMDEETSTKTTTQINPANIGRSQY